MVRSTVGSRPERKKSSRPAPKTRHALTALTVRQTDFARSGPAKYSAHRYSIRPPSKKPHGTRLKRPTVILAPANMYIYSISAKIYTKSRPVNRLQNAPADRQNSSPAYPPRTCELSIVKPPRLHRTAKTFPLQRRTASRCAHSWRSEQRKTATVPPTPHKRSMVTTVTTNPSVTEKRIRSVCGIRNRHRYGRFGRVFIVVSSRLRYFRDR